MERKETQKNTLQRAGRLAAVGLPFMWATVLFLFMNATSPLQSGPLSVLAAFVLIYLLISSLLYTAMIIVFKVMQLLGQRSPLGNKTLYYLVSVIGLGPVFVLALNTLGQLEIKDTLLVIVLVSIGCFYVLRRNRKEVF